MDVLAEEEVNDAEPIINVSLIVDWRRMSAVDVRSRRLNCLGWTRAVQTEWPMGRGTHGESSLEALRGLR